MPKINVVKAFKLTLDDGQIHEFVPGEFNVPKEVADHWFTKAHLADFDPPPPPEGSHEWIVSADEKRRADQATAQQVINDAAAQAAATQAASVRQTEEMIRQAQFRAAEQIETVAAKGGQVPNAQSDQKSKPKAARQRKAAQVKTVPVPAADNAAPVEQATGNKSGETANSEPKAD